MKRSTLLLSAFLFLLFAFVSQNQGMMAQGKLNTKNTSTKNGSIKTQKGKAQKKESRFLDLSYGYLTNQGLFSTNNQSDEIEYIGSTFTLDWGRHHTSKGGSQLAYLFSLNSYVFEHTRLRSNQNAALSSLTGDNRLNSLLQGNLIVNPTIGFSCTIGSRNKPIMVHLTVKGGTAFNIEQVKQIDWVKRDFSQFQPSIALNVSPSIYLNFQGVAMMVGYDIQFMGSSEALSTDLSNHLAFAPQFTYFINR